MSVRRFGPMALRFFKALKFCPGSPARTARRRIPQAKKTPVQGGQTSPQSSVRTRSRAEVDVAVAQVVAARVICGPVGPAAVVASPPSASDNRRPPPPVYKDAIAEEAAMENKPSISGRTDESRGGSRQTPVESLDGSCQCRDGSRRQSLHETRQSPHGKPRMGSSSRAPSPMRRTLCRWPLIWIYA